MTAQLVFTALLTEATNAYGKGVTAADPQASGTFVWPGIAYPQDTVIFTLRDGRGSSTGGAWTPIAYARWIAATIVVGRLWRAVSVPRRSRITV